MAQAAQARSNRGKGKKSFSDRKRDKQKDHFLYGLRNGMSILASCNYAGIAESTAYEWRNTDESFSEAWLDAATQGRPHIIEQLEAAGIDRAKEKSDGLIKFFLSKLDPSTYGEDTQVPIEVNLTWGSMSNPIPPKPNTST